MNYYADYAIASGFDASELVNIETVVTWPPSSAPLAEGSIKEKTVDGRTQVNGARIAVWEWRAMSYDDFDALASYFGQAVTIHTRDGLTDFGTYNAYADRPQAGVDYQVSNGGIRDLRLSFDVVGEVV